MTELARYLGVCKTQYVTKIFLFSLIKGVHPILASRHISGFYQYGALPVTLIPCTDSHAKRSLQAIYNEFFAAILKIIQ